MTCNQLMTLLAIHRGTLERETQLRTLPDDLKYLETRGLIRDDGDGHLGGYWLTDGGTSYVESLLQNRTGRPILDGGKVEHVYVLWETNMTADANRPVFKGVYLNSDDGLEFMDKEAREWATEKGANHEVIGFDKDVTTGRESFKQWVVEVVHLPTNYEWAPPRPIHCWVLTKLPVSRAPVAKE